MLQVVFDFGTLEVFGLQIPLRILGYGLMMVMGFISGILLAQWRARRMGENVEILTHCGILSLVGGIVGARAAYIIQHWDTQFARAPDKIGAMLNVSSGGLIYFGGLFLATAMVLAYLWIKRLSIRRYLDILAVSIMVGLAFGRAGCLLNGCCYGSSCHDDFALGMRFPMYSRPLAKFASSPGPYSDSTDGPSPVYAVQFARNEVRPDPRLTELGVGGGRRLRLPRELHGTLEQDQLEIMFAPEARARELFGQVAGKDGQIDRFEWDAHLGAEGGFLRGSEVWADAMVCDKDHNGRLSFDEAWRQYLLSRRSFLARRFGIAEERHTGPSSRPSQAAWTQADAYLRESLFDLAGEHWSHKVLPAQALGIVNALLIAALLGAFYRHRRREGQVFGLMLVLYPLTRFMLELIRSDNEHDLLTWQLTHNQWTSLGMLLGGVVMLVWLRRLPASAGPTWAERAAHAAATKDKGKSRRS